MARPPRLRRAPSLLALLQLALAWGAQGQTTPAPIASAPMAAGNSTT